MRISVCLCNSEQHWDNNSKIGFTTAQDPLFLVTARHVQTLVVPSDLIAGSLVQLHGSVPQRCLQALVADNHTRFLNFAPLLQEPQLHRAFPNCCCNAGYTSSVLSSPNQAICLHCCESHAGAKVFERIKKQTACNLTWPSADCAFRASRGKLAKLPGTQMCRQGARTCEAQTSVITGPRRAQRKRTRS